MRRLYSTNAASRRWTMHVFYNILHISVIKAWIPFRNIHNSTMSSRDFLLKLAEELRREHLVGKRCTPKFVVTRQEFNDITVAVILAAYGRCRCKVFPLRPACATKQAGENNFITVRVEQPQRSSALV
jgi:hypothetical protein